MMLYVTDDDDDDDVFRLTAAVLAAAVAVYNIHVFWTMSLHRDGTSLTCDAYDDNYFMIHVFEYLKLVSYCLVPFVIVIILNLCIIVRLRQASPGQCLDAVSVSSSTVSTPRRSVLNRSRRYFFAKKSTTSEQFVQQNAVDEGNAAERASLQDKPRSPSRREVMLGNIHDSGGDLGHEYSRCKV